MSREIKCNNCRLMWQVSANKKYDEVRYICPECSRQLVRMKNKLRKKKKHFRGNEVPC